LTRTQRHIEDLRKGDACVQVLDAAGSPRAGVPVSVEQDSHSFPFGCVTSDLTIYSGGARRCYRERLDEVFNVVVPAGQAVPTDAGIVRVDIAERTDLGALRVRLDRLAVSGVSAHVHVWGDGVGLSEHTAAGDAAERDAGQRLADLYTLCFAHRAVTHIFWNGLADADTGARGGGLLRRDLAPRYAFKVLQKLIGVVWHSRASGTTDAHGHFRFRGFFGDYRVVVGVGQAGPLVSALALHRDGPGTFPIGAARPSPRTGMNPGDDSHSSPLV
jgi:hypothetical protein